MPNSFDTLQQVLNYRFADPELIRLALTHRSANSQHNERLEFLGDSLLGFIVAEHLYSAHPTASEGELSRMRSSLVKKESLVQVARELHLGDYINLGSGELKSGGKQRDSILADAVEALIAALYLDGGMAACKPIVQRWCIDRIGQKSVVDTGKDAKTQLQEIMQAEALPLPEYEVMKITGEAHQQTFHVQCRIASLAQTYQGSGTSKRLAEQEAAAKVLSVLGEKA